MSTRWAEPLVATLSKPTTSRLKAKDWVKNGRKKKILELHRSGATCSQIREVMLKEFNFNASVASYKARFKEWGLREYFNKKQRGFILKERAKRGKMPKFFYINTNEMVDERKVERLWQSRDRYGKLRDEHLSPGGLMAVSTPSPCPDTQAMTAGASSEPVDVIMAEALEADTELIVRPNTTDGPCRCALSINTPRGGSELLDNLVAPTDLVTSTPDNFDDLSEVVMRIMRLLNVPFDYHIQRYDGSAVGAPVPRRKGLGSITPMSPNGIDVFMSSYDVSKVLAQVNKFLLDSNIKTSFPIQFPVRSWIEEPRIGTSNESVSKKSALSEFVLVDKDTWEDVATSQATVSTLGSSDSVMVLTRRERTVLRRIEKDYMTARRFYNVHRYSDAINILEAAISSYKSSGCFLQSSISFLDANYLLCRCLLIEITNGDITTKAEEILRKISLAYTTRLGASHEKSRRSHNLLGYTLIKNKNLDEALEFLHFALNGRDLKAMSELRSPSLKFDAAAMESAHYMAEIYLCQGNDAMAISLSEMLLQCNIQDYGYQSKSSNRWRSYLSEIYIGVGDYGTALRYLTQVDAGHEEAFKIDPRDRLLTKNLIARCLLKLHKPEAARFVCETAQSEILSLTRMNCPSSNRNLWRIMGSLSNRIGDSYASQKNWNFALKHYERCLVVYKTVLTSETPRNVRIATGSIIKVINKRGPVMYLQPLVCYYEDTIRRCKSVVPSETPSGIRSSETSF